MRRFVLMFLPFLSIAHGVCFASEWVNYTCGNHVSAVARHGDTIWAGTWGGLALINRKTDEVTLLNKTNSKLADNEIVGLAADSSGSIFIGNRWLQKFDNNDWETYPSVNIGQADWVFCIAIDDSNNVYVGDGLYLKKFNGVSWDSVQLGSIILAYFRISAIAFDKLGNTLVGTSLGLYIIKNMAIVKNIPTQVIGEIYSILPDTNGTIWVGTNAKGLKKLDNTTWDIMNTMDTLITGTNIFCMSFDSKRDLWIGASNGLIMFDGQKWTIYNSTNTEIFKNFNTIISIEIDEHDTKWLGTRNNGLLKFDGTNWKSYTTSNSGLYDNSIRSIAIERGKNVWVYEGATHFLLFDGLHWTAYDTIPFKIFDSLFTFIYEDSTQIIWAGSDIALVETKKTSFFYLYNIWKTNRSGKIKRDKNGMIWMARNDGLWRYDGSQWKVYNTSNSPMPDSEVGRIMISDDNRVWFTSNIDNVLMSFDGQQWQTVYTCSPDYWISSIALDKKSNPWIGVGGLNIIGKEYGQGVLHYDGTQWESFTISNSELPSNSVTELEFDSTGNLWVGAYGGMAKYDNKNQWTGYTIQNSGLPDNSVEQIEIDDAGNKWIKTQFGGLAVFREGGVILKTEDNLVPPKNVCHPADGFIKCNLLRDFLYFSLRKACNIEINVFNLSGKCIYKTPVKRYDQGYHQIRLCNQDNLPNGAYLLNIKSENTQISRKVTIVR